MKYLDYDRMPAILERYFGGPGRREVRLVGCERSYDSGYIDIVRFFGPGSVAPGEVEVKYLVEPFQLRDPLIRGFAFRAEDRLRREGRLYRGPSVMRPIEANLSSPPCFVVVQECDYGMAAGSCFALDLRDRAFAGRGDSLREYYLNEYPATGLAENPLAVPLGVCGLLLLRDAGGRPEEVLVVHRAGHLASLENSLGPAAAGSVDWVASYGDLGELIEEAIRAEVEEELGLGADECRVVPLAWAREIFRGEKPQLFCLLETPLTGAQLRPRLDDLKGRGEFDGYELCRLGSDLCLERAAASRFNHEARMNYCLLEEYLALTEG